MMMGLVGREEEIFRGRVGAVGVVVVG